MAEYLFYAPARRAGDAATLATTTRSETGPYRAGGLVPFYQALSEAIAQQGEASEVTPERAYQAVAFARRCVGLRAKTLASTPYVVLQGERAVYDSDRDDEMPDALAFLKGFKTLLMQHEMDLSLSAWSFALRETGREVTAPGQKKTPPLALSWLKPASMSIDRQKDIDDRGRLVSYTRKVELAAGGYIETHIPVERLIVLREPTPFHETGRGSSDADAARMAAGGLFRYEEFIEGHLGGGLLKDVLFSVGDPSGQGRIPRDTKEAESKLTRWLKRRRKADKPAQIVSDLLNVHELGEGLAGLANEHLLEGLRQSVAAAFGVPYALLMDQGETAYHALLGKYIQLYQLTLFFEMDLIEEAYNDQLLLPLGYRLRFETDRLEALQWAEVQKAQALQALTGGAAILSVEEARATLGYEGPAPAPQAADVGDALPGRAYDIVLHQGF